MFDVGKEGIAQEQVAGALEDHQAQSRALPFRGGRYVRHMKLIDHMARMQRHIAKFADIPGMKDHAAAAGIGLEIADHRGDLVMHPPLGITPLPPLLTVDRAEIAPLERESLILQNPLLEGNLIDILSGGLAIFRQRPVRPDPHVLLQEIADVGITGQKPEHFLDGELPVDALRREDRDLPLGKVEAHHRAEAAQRADAGPVDPAVTVLEQVRHQVEILILRVTSHLPLRNRLKFPDGAVAVSGCPPPRARPIPCLAILVTSRHKTNRAAT